MRQIFLLLFLFILIGCVNEAKIETVKIQKVILDDTVVTKKVKVEPKKTEARVRKEDEEISYCKKLTNEDLQGLTLKEIGLLRVTAVISESSNLYPHSVIYEEGYGDIYERIEVDKRAVDLKFYSCENREFRISSDSSSQYRKMFYSRYNEHKYSNKFIPEFENLVFFNFISEGGGNIETIWRKENNEYFYLGTIGTYLDTGKYSSSGINRVFETISNDKIIVGLGSGGDGGSGGADIWFARWSFNQPAEMLKMITYAGEYNAEMANGIEYSFNAINETVTLFPRTKAFRDRLKEKTFPLKNINPQNE